MRAIPVFGVQAHMLVQIVCDASPWGLGAILLLNSLPIEWFADAIWDSDHSRLGTQPGLPDGQSAFEALAVLVALRTWMARWRNSPTEIILQSDSLAALGAAAKAGSQVPSMNMLMQELALDWAEGLYEISLFGHVPGRLNTWADDLSRLYDPNEAHVVPEELLHVPGIVPAPRDASWWRASSPPSS